MSKGIARRCAGSRRAGLAAPGSRRVFPPYLLQPQTVFQECPEKPDRADSCLAHLFSPFFFFFILSKKIKEKRVGTPPSREPRMGNRQTESALSLDCSPAQTARCAFNTFESDIWPAAVRFFFFLSPSFLLLFHRGLLRSSIFISVIGRERALGRRTEDTGEDMTRHRRLREWMEAKEGQMARAGGPTGSKYGVLFISMEFLTQRIR